MDQTYLMFELLSMVEPDPPRFVTADKKMGCDHYSKALLMFSEEGAASDPGS